MEELSQAAVLRINPSQELTLVVPDRNSVVSLPCAGLPSRLLASENQRESIQIGDDAAAYGLIKGEQACLVGEQLADRDRLLSLLREFRPVGAYALFVVEP